MTTARDVIAEPTEAMLIAARDWSYGKYGKPIGNDAAIGCWKAMFEAALSAPDSVRLELAALLNPPAKREKGLARLWDAIVENTRGEAMFWIGEILLAELEKETGFRPAPPSEDK